MKSNNYLTTDLKLQAFLRTMLPESFIGINKTNPHKVAFVFKDSKEIQDFVRGYFERRRFAFSPLIFAENIEQGKAMIFGDY